MRLWDLLLYELQGDTQGSQARGRSGMTSSRGPLLVSITTSLHQHSTSLDLFTSFRVRIPTTYSLCSYLLTHLSSDSSPYFLHLFLGTVCILCFGEWLKICLWLKLDCTVWNFAVCGCVVTPNGPPLHSGRADRQDSITGKTRAGMGVKRRWGRALSTPC